MPSLTARTLGWLLRTTGSVWKRYEGGPAMPRVIELARSAPLPVPTAAMQRTLAVRETMFDGRSVWHLAPRTGATRAQLLYFHGGGYVFSAVPPHWQFYAHLARRHDIAVTAPLYPLAPEAGAEETTAWALALYRDFVERQDGPFVLGGDSAGAGLAAATLMAARDAGLRLPSAVLLLSPWLDISGTHPDQPGIEPRDSVLRLRGIRDAGAMYARALPVDDWRVSPIHGDWSGLPPMLVYGGADDILVTDARDLAAKRPDADYREGAGLMHDWPLFRLLPEARVAQDDIARYIIAHH